MSVRNGIKEKTFPSIALNSPATLKTLLLIAKEEEEPVGSSDVAAHQTGASIVRPRRTQPMPWCCHLIEMPR
jgi:hypothetical protein